MPNRIAVSRQLVEMRKGLSYKDNGFTPLAKRPVSTLGYRVWLADLSQARIGSDRPLFRNDTTRPLGDAAPDNLR